MDVREGNAVRIDDSTFDSNRSRRGAAVILDNSRMEMRGCTMYGNRSDDASIVFTRTSDALVERCVMSFAHQGASAILELDSTAYVSNCIIFGNAGGDSLSRHIERQSGNLFTDPLFCDISARDYSVCANSPCLPDNNPWAVQVGAHGEGCGVCSTPVERTSWSAIKAMYR